MIKPSLPHENTDSFTIRRTKFFPGWGFFYNFCNQTCKAKNSRFSIPLSYFFTWLANEFLIVMFISFTSSSALRPWFYFDKPHWTLTSVMLTKTDLLRRNTKKSCWSSEVESKVIQFFGITNLFKWFNSNILLYSEKTMKSTNSKHPHVVNSIFWIFLSTDNDTKCSFVLSIFQCRNGFIMKDRICFKIYWKKPGSTLSLLDQQLWRKVKKTCFFKSILQVF